MEPRNKPGRKASLEVSEKQLEVFELILNTVMEFGYQPSLRELKDLLGVSSPSIRARLIHLVAKGMLTPPPHGSERCYGFVGLKFLAYQTDASGNPLEKKVTVGDCEVTFKKKQV